MLSKLKAKLFAFTDFLDRLNPGPFEGLTRPAYPLTSTRLCDKARSFEDDLLQNFVMKDLVYYEIPQDTRLAWPSGDLAIWHGHAVAYSALKFAVTGNPQDFQMNWLTGMTKLFDHENGRLRLLRGVSPAGVVSDDASNDSATGILVGCYFAMKFGPVKAKEFALFLLGSLADSLAAHDFALIGADGYPTTYGSLVQGPLTDPLRLSLCMAIFASVGATEVLEKLAGYRALLPYAKLKLWWFDSWSDTHRAMSHLAILHQAQLFPEVETGLARLWAMMQNSGNLWIASLYHWSTVGLTAYDKENFRMILTEWDVLSQKLNSERDNSRPPFWPGYKKVHWQGQWCASQPVPVHLKGSDEFRDARNPYSLRSGTTPPSARHHGLGYLLPYWFGRYLGLVGENE